LSLLIEHFTTATAALSAGRQEGGVMAEAVGLGNGQPASIGGKHLNPRTFRAMVGRG
jgi:hypothetical protein